MIFGSGDIHRLSGGQQHCVEDPYKISLQVEREAPQFVGHSMGFSAALFPRDERGGGKSTLAGKFKILLQYW